MPAERRSAQGKPSRQTARQIPGEQYLKRREKSDIWQIEFIIDGCRVRESSGTADKVAASALALLRWDEVWRQVKLGETPKRDVTVNEAFTRYYLEVAKGTPYGERSQKHQLAAMKRALGGSTRLAELSDGVVNDMVQALRKPEKLEDGRAINRSPATINRYLTTLNCVCGRAREVWGCEVGAWKRTKHRLAEAEGREVFLDHRQARALLAAACGHLRPILLLDLMTGLRRGNVLGLLWEQVSLDMGRAVLLQKGDRRLGITLPPMAIELLAGLQPDPAKRTGPVFFFANPAVPCGCPHCASPAYRGKPIRSIKRAFATAARNAGVRDMPSGRLRFHDLRHTFASWLLAQDGGSLRLVQEALGHRNIATTARYTHLMAGSKEAVIAGATAALLEPGAPTTDQERKKA